MGRQLNKYVASQLEQKAIPRIKRPKATQILVIRKQLYKLQVLEGSFK